MKSVLHRRYGIWILFSFLLAVWQCYYINWTQAFKIMHSLHIASADKESHRPTIATGLKESDRTDGILKVTGDTGSNKDIVPVELEHYELMTQYEREALTSSEQVPYKPYKKILFWNEAYGNKNYGVGIGADALKKAGCPVWQCETSDNRTAVEEYDALIFHLRSWTKDDLPKVRSPNQRYVFWSIESAGFRFVNTYLMRDFFNWTMTYRWDSDIVNSYGWFVPTTSNNSSSDSNPSLHPSLDELKHIWANNQSKINYAEGKSKMAAWFVSNCNLDGSNRRELVNFNGKNIFMCYLTYAYICNFLR